MWNKGLFKVLAIGVAILASVILTSARPQTQLKWNWEEVILSRNGPSTTTTPRPTSWSTTTLRFLDIAPVKSAGSVGIVEDVNVVPRPRKGQNDENSSSSMKGVLLLVLLSVGLQFSL